jgi:hypothetical protein
MRCLVWSSSRSNGDLGKGSVCVLDETMSYRSVDATGHSVFKGEVRHRKHRVINRGYARRKKHCSEDNAEADGDAKKYRSGQCKLRMRLIITSSRAVHPLEDALITWGVPRPQRMTWHGLASYLL